MKTFEVWVEGYVCPNKQDIHYLMGTQRLKPSGKPANCYFEAVCISMKRTSHTGVAVSSTTQTMLRRHLDNDRIHHGTQ